MLRAISAEYFNGLVSSLQGFLILHKIDNPPGNSTIADQQKRTQNAVNAHQTVLENRRRREQTKKFGKSVQNLANTNSTVKRVASCILTNLASVFLVLLVTWIIEWIGPSFLSHLINWLCSMLLIPIFLTIRPLSLLWFADVAGAALKYRGQSGQKISDLSHAASDFLHAFFLELFFLLQALVIISVDLPFLPSLFTKCLGFVCMTLLHSLYCFDYIWMSDGIILASRVALIERRWAFHLGFGTILTLATSYSSNFFINGCIFGALFPFFIISSCLCDANKSTEHSQNIPPIHFYYFAQQITNKLSVQIFGRIT